MAAKFNVGDMVQISAVPYRKPVWRVLKIEESSTRMDDNRVYHLRRLLDNWVDWNREKYLVLADPLDILETLEAIAKGETTCRT